MPELPEVETIRRGLAPALEGRRIAGVTVRRRDLRVPVPADFEKRVTGARVQTLARRGKYILALLAGGPAMVLHMGMAGRMTIVPAGGSYKERKHDHIIWDLDNGGRLVMNDPRRFGMAYLAEEWAKEKPFSAMGPEPLGEAFNGPVLAAGLAGLKTNIKAALLDQRIVAGVGNIYACEALYAAGISPLRMAGSIKGKRADALARALRAVLARAIEAGGASLKDYRHADGTPGYFQMSFSVYDREGRPCRDCACSKGVRRIVQAGRSSFYCPRRQR